jgi:hypothetical protein
VRISAIKAFWLWAIPALALVAGSATASEVLVDPPAISVPPGLTDKLVAKSIRLGVAQRGWIVTRQDPGYMEATLHLRTHVAKVGINYDASSIKVRYLESQNLDYAVKKGVPRIHGNYLKWVNNLVGDISLQLQSAEMDLEKPE